MNKKILGVAIVVTLGYGVTTMFDNKVEGQEQIDFFIENNNSSESFEREEKEIVIEVGHDERFMKLTSWGTHKDFVHWKYDGTRVYEWHVDCVNVEREIVNQAIVKDGKVIEVLMNQEKVATRNVCEQADNY